MPTEIMFLTYNRRGIVARCFQSLAPVLLRDNVRWSVLDNASTDGTAAWLLNLHRTWPLSNMTLHLSTVNRGVSGGRDFLLRHSVGRNLVFADSDIYAVHDRWLDTLLSHISDPSVGLAGPGGHHITLHPDGAWNWFDPVDRDYIGDVDVVSGYLQAFRRDAIEGFEMPVKELPRYGLEDSWQCLWLRSRGYAIRCTGDIGVHHIYSNSAKEVGWEKRMTVLENKWAGQRLIRAERATG